MPTSRNSRSSSERYLSGKLLLTAGLSMAMSACPCTSRSTSVPESFATDNMNHINRTLDSEGDCGVYFFKTWTGYSHPVTPMEPCTYEQAIRQTSYYRAWLCASGGKNRFLMLEGMLQSAKPYAGQLPAGIPGDVEFLRVVRHGDAVEAAAPLELADTFDEREYVRLERLGDGGLSPSLVNVRLKLRYRYHYGANGALKKADITNIDGETTTLDF